MVGARFLVDPVATREAVLSGKQLLVEVWGDRLQYRKVTVVDPKKVP